MAFICELCNTEFTRKSSLLAHKQTAQYCLSIQGVSHPLTEYSCVSCEKKYKSKRPFEKHLTICLKKGEPDAVKIATECKKQIAELETKLVGLSNDVTNNITNNITNDTGNITSNINTFKIKLLDGSAVDIGIRKDGHINATQLCKAGGKLFGHYKESKQTQDYLQALSHVIGIPLTELINIKQGGINQGTYVHRKVSYHLAQWISPHFAVQVSNILDELILTGKVELGKEKSRAELDNIYETRIEELNNKLKRYECSLFNTEVDVCPVEFFGKDVIYFLRYKIPEQLLSEYSSIYPNITNKEFACIEFGITSNLEQRLSGHKKDKRKNEVIFIHAFKLDKRYTASKVEYYVKTIAKQLGVNFEYERSKESILVNEVTFNVMLNRIKEGIDSIDRIELCADIEVNNNVEDMVDDIPDNIRLELRRLELNHELKVEKQKNITDLMKNDKITIEQYINLIKEI
jgi:predicted GIY-YIG superfamily endonuclease